MKNLLLIIYHYLIDAPPSQKKIAIFLLLNLCAPVLRLMGWGNYHRKSVLYVGQAYYNSWYLSRALRKFGWKADLLNWDLSPNSQIYYHGEDFIIEYKKPDDLNNYYKFYIKSIKEYDIFHFANKGGLQFGEAMRSSLESLFGEEGIEIRFLKALGKKIVYSNNGCLDGVSQTVFSSWGPESVCSICKWQKEPSVCSDEKNQAWGRFRNDVADFQCLHGGNRVEYNNDPRVHEVPEFFCLDKEFWRPDIEIPDHYRLPDMGDGVINLYHGIGNRSLRTNEEGVNIKSSHIYLPLLTKLKAEGYKINLIEPSGIPNKEVRYLQAQSDIFLEMLTYGWFGANVREAMMLGKPVICYLRPEWMDSVRQELPDYINELPIISATPYTVENVLRDLILNKDKRLEIGRRSREFAVKWHSAEVGAHRFDKIYRSLFGLKI